TDDERTDSKNGDQAMTDADKIVAETLEEEKGDEEEEQANYDQAQEDQAKDDIVGTLVTMSQKEKPGVPRSRSNHSLSSNYASLLDVLVSVIPPQITTITTPTPLPTLPITSTTQPVTSLLPDTKTLDALVPQSKAFTAVLQRLSTLEKDVKDLKQVDHSTIIFKSIRSQVPPAVNEFLGSSLGDSLQKDMSLDVEENIVDETGNANEHPNGKAAPKTDNASKNNRFKQPPRPPTLDPEWNKCQVIDDQPEQTWFNDLVSGEKDPLTFDVLMATPIDFSKFSKNRL
nr:hypothetical protein [Tanacetum cinerariifolium]